MSAAEWLDRGERSLADLVTDFRPDQHLRLAVATRQDLGLAPVREVLRKAFVHEPIGAAERRWILKALVDRRVRELVGEVTRGRQPGRLDVAGTKHGTHEHVPGSWMCRVVSHRGWNHAPTCVCPRCAPPPEDEAWITDALLAGVDARPGRG